MSLAQIHEMSPGAMASPGRALSDSGAAVGVEDGAGLG
jgi:hypothetical protein